MRDARALSSRVAVLPHPPRARSTAAARRSAGVRVEACDAAQRQREAAAQQRTFRALDMAMQAINRMLSMGDMFGGFGDAPRAPASASLPAGDAAVVAAPPARAAGRSKRVSFRARARTERQVKQAPSARLLNEYLSLPAEEYNLLDPEWVCRLDDSTFRFSVPLGAILSELMQGAPAPADLARLVPAITVRTSLDAAAARLTLRGSEASLGHAETDESFALSFETTMAWSGGPPPGWAHAPDAAPDAAPLWRLACDTDVRGELAVPPPLSALPRPVLGTAGSLLAKAVAQAVLPRFAEMLAADYARWAVGSRRSADGGLLVAAAPQPVLELPPPPLPLPLQADADA